MCGLPLETPVPDTLYLSDEELELSRSLLNAVIHSWDKISNSTVENLRSSFLVREGRLDEVDDFWSLTVESKAYNILLGFLPWTISIIKLPWMEKQVQVTWQTNFH